MDIGVTAILALAAVAGGGGVVVLLAQRAGMAARLAAALERAGVVERELEEARRAMREASEGLSRATAEAARLAEAVSGLERAREEDRIAAREDVAMAVESAGRVHAEQMERVERVSAERLAAARQANAQVETKLAEFEKKMKESFGALAGEALASSSGEFLKLAEQRFTAAKVDAQAEMDKRKAAVEQLLAPIRETLARSDARLNEIKQEWAVGREGLAKEMQMMAAAGEGLRAETLRLTRALSRPEVRGRYGELQLRRVAELAGMAGYCDFSEQASQRDGEGKLLRPDMIVKLPNERVLAVDAKTNTDAYLEACNASDESEREACLERFARHVAEQVGMLAKKSYWSQFESSPEFVVMFVPGDQFLDAALARRADLLELAAGQNVILASPSTLIGLLRAVAVGWREKKVTDQAQELIRLGTELHERSAIAYGKVASVGDALNSAVKCYNEFVGSYESRLEPSLRRFEDVGVKSKKELPEVTTVNVRARVTER